MLKGFTRRFRSLEIATNGEVEAIRRGTLEVLQEAGVRISHQRALEVFAERGCQVDFDESRVRIPGWLVEDCLRKCPGSFVIRARDPENNIRVGGNVVHFENAIGLKTVDLKEWTPRSATKAEEQQGVAVLDELSHVHVLTALTPYSDVEGSAPCMTNVESLASRIRNSDKCQAAGHFYKCEVFAIKMAKAVGTDLLGTVTASPPLAYREDAVEAIFRFAHAGFPIVISSGAVMGSTGPTTIAGATVSINAELAAGICLTQLLKPGTPVVVSDSVYPMDMRRGNPVFGALGAVLHNALFNQVWHSYGIPTCSWMPGITSSKKIDFQCAQERAMGTLMCALSGSNLLSLHGGIYGELTWHPVQAVLDEDIAGWVGRTLEGVEVTDETLAIDLIKEVGFIPGQYLTQAHTRKWWRKEQFVPACADRTSYAEWIDGGKKDALALGKERVRQIVGDHHVTPLSRAQNQAIDEIIAEAEAYYRPRELM